MKTTLCTLFNSLYLDKGLVLYDSLKACSNDFELYVLCMDDNCYDVLSDIGNERLKLIHLPDIENIEMLKAKSNRTFGEYCWTCSSRLIQYIFDMYNPECCTYIDADMYFYYDPQMLVDEMLRTGKSVMMVPHRFTERDRYYEKKVGKYCVEFNCFKNNNAGLEVLNHWHIKCLECCSNLGDGIHWGDQKYMDEWPLLFPNSVYVCNNPGAGVATWNIDYYKLINKKDYSVQYKPNQNVVQLIFYHFASISNITSTMFKINIREGYKTIDYELVEFLYSDYLEKIIDARNYLLLRYNLILGELPRRNTINYIKLKLLLLFSSKIGINIRKMMAPMIISFRHFPFLCKVGN